MLAAWLTMRCNPAATDQLRPGALSLAGKEFYALAWVLAQSSRAIAQTLAQIPDTSTAAIFIPDVPGLSPSRMYEVCRYYFDNSWLFCSSFYGKVVISFI